MPIHDQGYRRYAGHREPHGRRWWVIARAGMLAVIRQRRFLGLLLVAWFPFIVRVVQIYVSQNFQQVSFLAPKAEMFRDFLAQQGLFVLFVTVSVGAPLIANDRRANALQIYLSKPLTRVEYVVGKLAILLAFLLLVTWAPAVLLLVVQMLFAGSLTFIRSNLFLIPAITLVALVESLVASCTMLALSATSRSSRFVSIMFVGVIFFTSAIANVSRAMTGRTTLAWVSPTLMLDELGDLVFRLHVRSDVPPAVAVLVVAGLVLGSMAILERRVRGVEVVT